MPLSSQRMSSCWRPPVILAGARSLMKVCTVWQDQIIRECTRFQRIPCDSQFGRILKLFRFASVVELETAIHQMRGRVWKSALRSGKSTVYALKLITIDLDSTVKTCFGFQEGAKKGFNEKKIGALSYHPQLAFCVETKNCCKAGFAVVMPIRLTVP